MAEPDPVVSERGSWSGAVRSWLRDSLPLEHLLPERQPFYVGSWVYVFGVATIAALVWVVLSGVILSFEGPQWWHESVLGRFFNSLHFWAVQVFFVFMVLHLWGQYFAAGWRDGRASTWIVGVVVFAVAVVAGLTGYVSQQNFDAQWIAVNAKDAVNAIGMGALFNVLNFGQMYGLHILLLPTVIAALVVVHLALVRMRGVVKPIERAPAR
ncbi:MAG: cytochrome b N-terminal domain-containing protein [Chloroflexota bacterium]|nr:cytochrome b N-terminal domain-containing protein [Chloroflexota bacterium]